MTFLEQMRRHSELGRVRRQYGETTPRMRNNPLSVEKVSIGDLLRLRQDCFELNMRLSETEKCLDMIVRSFV